MTLPSIAEINFLSSVGEPHDEFAVVSSWDDAVSSLTSDAWGDFTQNAQGDLTEWLSSNAPSRYQGVWNNRIRELRPMIERLVEETLLTKIPVSDSPGLRDALNWDLLLIAIDSDYHDLKRRPGLPSRMRDCYASGHIPCGFSDAQSQIIAY